MENKLLKNFIQKKEEYYTIRYEFDTTTCHKMY